MGAVAGGGADDDFAGPDCGNGVGERAISAFDAAPLDAVPGTRKYERRAVHRKSSWHQKGDWVRPTRSATELITFVGRYG